MIAGAVDDGLCFLEFHDRHLLPVQQERIEKLLHASFEDGNHPHLLTAKKQLTEYFDGDRQTFDVPLTYPGSPFQRKVWNTLLEIPYGKVLSYAQQSELLGNKKAIRAMAKANGDNRIAIIIPCHRVIGSDGSLIGYGGKLWRKKALLELEGALPQAPTLFD